MISVYQATWCPTTDFDFSAKQTLFITAREHDLENKMSFSRSFSWDPARSECLYNQVSTSVYCGKLFFSNQKLFLRNVVV